MKKNIIASIMLLIIAVGSIFLIEHAKENIESSMDAYESIEASENNEATNLDTSLDITDEEKNAIQLGCTKQKMPTAPCPCRQTR